MGATTLAALERRSADCRQRAAECDRAAHAGETIRGRGPAELELLRRRWLARAEALDARRKAARELRARAGGSLREAVRLAVAELGAGTADSLGGTTADAVAERVACSSSAARRHALALAEAGELRAERGRRWDSQGGDAARTGLFGGAGACKRRTLTLYPATAERPGGVHGSY